MFDFAFKFCFVLARCYQTFGTQIKQSIYVVQKWMLRKCYIVTCYYLYVYVSEDDASAAWDSSRHAVSGTR